MFCPKCGTQNPDDGKFCRSCGVDLGNVNAAMNGTLAPLLNDLGLSCDESGKPKRQKTADEIYSDAVRSIISGFGFIIVSCVLFFTNVANGQKWFWVFLFPAFTFLAKGFSEFAKSRRMERSVQMAGQPTLNQMPGYPTTALPPQQTSFVAPESRYKTGDLVPASVTDSTTKLLEVNKEGETMTLPKA